MSNKTKIDRRKFIQFSALASAGAAVGCGDSGLEFPAKAENLSAVGNGFTPRKLKRKLNILVSVHSPISRDYESPFVLEGLRKVTVEVNT